MNTSYKPSHIANYFLLRANKENIQITQLKLLKLVYIGYGWVLAVLNEKLFKEEIEAWQHGPVIPSLYNEFKHFGKQPINTLATEFDLENFKLSFPKIDINDENTLMVLGKVWDVYHKFSAWALRSKTHEENTPWTDTVKNGEDLGNIIDPNLIKTHFQRKIAKYIDAAR